MEQLPKRLFISDRKMSLHEIEVWLLERRVERTREVSERKHDCVLPFASWIERYEGHFVPLIYLVFRTRRSSY